MEEELEKVEDKIQRIGRREEKSKLDNGSDKLNDLLREMEEKIHEVGKKLNKVDQRIEDQADTNTEEPDELAANVRQSLGRVKEKIEHHKDEMTKNITVLREDMADALEKCSTNMAEKIDKRAMDMREEVQSACIKYRDDVHGKYTDIVNHLQTRLADRYVERMYGSMPTPTTTKRTSPFTKATTRCAMSMDAPRNDEETFYATESVAGPSRLVASKAVQLRASPNWMPVAFWKISISTTHHEKLLYHCGGGTSNGCSQKMSFWFLDKHYDLRHRGKAAFAPKVYRSGLHLLRLYGTETHALDPAKEDKREEKVTATCFVEDLI